MGAELVTCCSEDDDGVADDLDVPRQRRLLLSRQLGVVDVEGDAEQSMRWGYMLLGEWVRSRLVVTEVDWEGHW